jgi:hypothetical protein
VKILSRINLGIEISDCAEEKPNFAAGKSIETAAATAAANDESIHGVGALASWMIICFASNSRRDGEADLLSPTHPDREEHIA